MLRRFLLVTGLAILASLVTPRTPAAQAARSAALPSGFTRVEVTQGLNLPTSFDFAAGKIFVTEKNSGKVRVVKVDGTLRSSAFVTLKTSTQSERGMLGIAADPNYATNKYLYVYYTTGPGAKNYSGSPKNRVSRFTNMGGVGVNEKIILDNIPSDAGNHNGGDIHFGFDGKLYIAIGDGGSFHNNAQTLNNLRGKLVRINKSGTIPNDNPFYHTTGARKEIFAYGFRNPFRFALRPSNSTYLVADVGQNTWEEIDSLQAGGNYGWNNYEGPCPANTTGCDPTATDFGLTIAPIHYYNHSSGAETGNVIIGGAVPDNSNYPSPYAGAYFYGDNGAGWIHALTLNVNNQETGRYDFDQLSCPSSFGIGPDNNLYVADLCVGKLYKYVYAP